MTEALSQPDPSAQSERALSPAPVVASPRLCPVCQQTPLRGRQEACSAKCRARKSRRERVPLPVDAVREIRSNLTAALEAVWEAKATLEKYGGG